MTSRQHAKSRFVFIVKKQWFSKVLGSEVIENDKKHVLVFEENHSTNS